MFCEKTAEKTAEILGVNIHTGLTAEQVQERRLRYGANQLRRQKEKPLVLKLAYQFSDPMVIILMVAAAISFVTEWMNGKTDFVDPAIILAIVFLNAGIGVFQERKAEKALEALKEMLSPTAVVRREGREERIPAEEILPGDILLIEAGDVIPADCRLLKAVSLVVDESSLTGEAHGVEKNPQFICSEETPLGDRENMIWSATLVSTGRGEGIVTATGMDTEVGRIAGILLEEVVPQTPLQQKLAKTGQSLGLAALSICGIIFVFGLIRAMPPMDIFLTAVSLAVAAIPEGLPAIVTIMLAIGVQRMADNRAIIRKLSAVETLGSASVICSDKTGTITQNRMSVREWWGNKEESLLCAVLCSNHSGQTETALLRSAEQNGYQKDAWEERYPRIGEEPFDSGKKWMGTVNRFPGGKRVFVKGAPDIVLERCQISEEEKHRVLKKNKEMASAALRVIAFAVGEGDTYENLRFAGLAGIVDPPRTEVKKAVQTCHEAGIRVVMVTGDHEDTAAAIAREAGLVEPEAQGFSVGGRELSSMTDEELAAGIDKYSVFARVTPKDKARIVKAYQKKGHIVAMTGDGVNDAPALKFADIGCAMGISGTEVSKEAADMVLADDNFATIVTAVREGRGIYDNIRKAVHFLLSSNIGEIITIFVAILIGWNSPLLPVQLLWINLITDSFPAIALGVDPADEDIMKRKPIRREKSLFAGGMTANIIVEGIMIGTLALFAFAIGYRVFCSLEVGRTMAFCVLAMSQLVHAFNMRNEEKSVFALGLFSNLYLTGAFFICCAMQIAVVSLPALAVVFRVVALNQTQWLMVAALSLVPLFFVEAEKLLLRILQNTR